MPADDSVTFEEYEDMLRLPEWARVENEFENTDEPLGVPSRGGAPIRPSKPERATSPLFPVGR
jgi:hypothetical protein